jgi:hypothetical protein
MNASEWISKNCRFAQQQQLLQFDPEQDWQDAPIQSHVLENIEEVVPQDVEKDEFLDGFYHVTTNLPAVLHWGALKSRKQLGTVPGLGGGAADEARNKVSLTYNYYKAQRIYDGLMFASNVIHNKVKASEIFDWMLREHGYDEIPDDSYMVLEKYKIPDSILLDEEHAGLEAALDAGIRGGKRKYEFLADMEDAMRDAGRASDDPSLLQNIVGFTADPATFAAINPANIAILKMQVRKGAPFEHVSTELELRFAPDDVRLAPNPVIKS